MALKTYADWEDAVRVARVVYDHSLARMVTRARTVKKSKRMAFLSVLSTTKSDNVSSEHDTNKKSSSSRQKSDVSLKASDHRRIGENRNIQIFIATPLASTICLQLHPSTSVTALKGLLHDRLGIEPTKQHLFTANNFELCDALSLADHGIERDTNIELRLVSGLIGGRKKKKSGTKLPQEAEENPQEQSAPAAEADSPEPPTSPTPPEGATAQSNQRDSSAQTEGINFNFNNCSITLGSSIGCKYHYELPVGIDVTKEGKTCDDYTNRLHDIVQDLVRKLETNLVGVICDAFRALGAELARVERGSVRFILHVKSRDDLDKLWNMFTSGELAKKLTEILITDELTTEDKSGLALRVTILESDYKKGCRFFEKLQTEPTQQDLPVCMSDWTKEHVNYWLLSIGVSGSVADKLYEGGIDGRVLKLYTKEHLTEDYSTMTTRDMRLILYSRESWLQSEEQPLTPTTKEEPSVQVLEESEKRGSGAVDQIQAPRQEQSPQLQPEVLIVPAVTDVSKMPPPAVRPKTPKSQAKSSPKKQKTEKIATATPNERHLALTHEVPEDPKPIEAEKGKLVESDEREKHSELEHSTPAIVGEGGQTGTSTMAGGGIVPTCEVKPLQAPIPVSPQTIKDDVAVRKSGEQSPEAQGFQGPKESPSPCEDERPNEPLKAANETHTSTEVPPFAKSVTEPEQPEVKENYEAKLRMLLTGDERGELDKSLYPVLVANRPPDISSAESESDPIRQQFEFIKTVKWSAVLDFDSKSLLNGLCKLYHDDRMVTLQQPDLFQHIESGEEFRNSIDFPEKTLWVFANGREDNPSIHTPRMALPDWNTERSRDVEASVTFFSQPTVIPEGRAVIMFLLLSDDNVEILCDTFRKISSSFQGLQNITCIAEDRDIYSKFVRGVSRWFTKDKIDERSVVGVKWRNINRIMMRMNDVNKTRDSELPFSRARTRCILSDKKREAWNDITVICKNECENTDMDESNPGYKEFVERKELNFYHGANVDWWNFAIGEKEVKQHSGCGHVLKRKGFGKLLRTVTNPLNSSRGQGSLIVTVTLLHQPGAGGSTLARHVLWELHRDHRCIVVNRVTNNTVNQIMEFRRFGYDNTLKIPPVCVLIDDLDDVEVVDLIAELEEVSRDIHLDGGAVCVLLRCKRNLDPEKIIKGKGHGLDIPLNQKLDPAEKEWFQQKYHELERKVKELQNGEYNPDNLLAFMVMKEEFNKEYIKNVVSRILHGVKGKEFELIKMCAFLNTYRPECSIPISCCDSFMTEKLTPRRTTYLTRRCAPLWDKFVSSCFKMVVITENQAIKIFHKSIAEEAFRQTRQMSNNQSLADSTFEFLNSELLESPSHSRQNLARSTHALLIRRKKLIYGDDTQTAFSVLIEDIYKDHGPETAIKILQLGFKKLEDSRVAQQIARLYLKEKDFDMAHDFANKALEIDSKNSYFWDTKGRIYKKHLDTLTEQCLVQHQVLGDKLCREFICMSYQAMDAFRKSYDVSKQVMQTEYTGLYAEVEVAFRLLQVIHLCVEPFRTHDDMNILRMYLLKLENPQGVRYPNWDNESHSRVKGVVNRVDAVLAIMDDITTQCKDGSYANIIKQKLDELRDNLKKYSKTYEHYYGEPTPWQTSRYSDQDPASFAEYRRRRVKLLQCGTFREIFDLVRENDLGNLELSRKLLLENSSNYSFLDLKILICIQLAFSSVGKNSMSADDIYQQFVRPLNALDKGTSNCWSPLFMVMFLWPIQDMASERRDKEDLSFHIDNLKNRWEGGIESTGQQMPRQDKVKRHTRFHVKPRTHFFLGKGKDLRVFAHINELHATQSKLDRRDGDDKFWQSFTVKDRLVRLEGILLNNTSLLHRSQKGKKINVKLAVPYVKRTPSQETVTFYLGFSWSGPVAYNVTPKGEESHGDTVPLCFDQAYPKHTLPLCKPKTSPSDHISKIDRLQKKRQELNRELKELQASLQDRRKLKLNKSQELDIRRKIISKQRELQRETTELIRAWQEDTYEDGS